MADEQITQTSGYFFAAVETFFQQGWMALGKIPNPFNGKTNRDLKLAEYAVSVLEALREKSKGNLTDDEAKILTEHISLLKSNYVVELNKPEEPETEKPETSEAEANESGTESSEPAKEEPKSDD